MRRSLLAGTFAFAASALPIAASAAPAYTLDGAQIFAGPGDQYPIVAQFGPGVAVEVDGCLNDYSWCDVSYGGNRGWVNAADLAYGSRRVPILQYGPTLGLPTLTFSLGDYWDRHYRGRPFYAERHRWEGRGDDHGERFRNEQRDHELRGEGEHTDRSRDNERRDRD